MFLPGMKFPGVYLFAFEADNVPARDDLTDFRDFDARAALKLRFVDVAGGRKNKFVILAPARGEFVKVPAAAMNRLPDPVEG